MRAPHELSSNELSANDLLFGEEVVEGSHGGEFIVFDVEDGVELGDVEDVIHFLGEVEELEFASGVADGSEAANEFSDARACLLYTSPSPRD